MSEVHSDVVLKVIDRLYAAALSPDHHDAFQTEWENYLAQNSRAEATDESAVAPHIDQALAIIDRLQFSLGPATDLQELIDQDAMPSAVITASGTVQFSNSAFAQIAPSQSLSIWDIIPDEREQSQVRAALRSAHDVSDKRTFVLPISLQSGKEQDLVSMRRLPANVDALAAPSLYKIQVGHPVWSQNSSAFLAETFGLTPAELAVLQGIVKGAAFQDIADGAKRSADTVKAQSKSIYRKLGVSGREATVRLVLQLHLIMGPQPQGETLNESENLVQLSSGRKVGYWTRGRPAGRPFLFLHGMSLGHNMTPDFISGLSDRNLRAICVDRPGYRTSDPPHDWRYSIEEWVALFPELLDQLGLTRMPIVTHTTGVMYACAAAAAHPSRVSGICALAGGVPITDPDMLAAYPRQSRIIARTARFSPTALRFLITSGTAFFNRKNGAEKIVRGTYSESAPDKAALDDPDIYKLVEQSVTLIGQQGRGYDGFVGDGLKVFSDWSTYPENLKCPLTYVIGDQDPICPLEWARAFAQRHTHITVEAIEDAGQLLHHTHPDLTLAHIERVCRDAD